MILPLVFALNTLQPLPSTVNLYVGTYTVGQASKGIYRVSLNTETGALSEPVVAAEMVNPSYLAFNSSGKNLYAVNESGKGEVYAFAVDAAGNLAKLSSQSTAGSDPCHVFVSPGDKSVLVANYSSGSVAEFPIQIDGSVGEMQGQFQNHGTGPNHERQEAPHMHLFSVDASRRFAYACDLGADEVVVFRFDKVKGRPILSSPTVVKTPAGAGPRHAVLDHRGRILYVNNEMANSVSVFEVSARSGPTREIQNIPTLLPENATRRNTTAEIVLHPNGNWLYVSNRGDDSIACYAVGAGGMLKLQDVVHLAVHEPRGFAIDPTGKWLVVGGQHSNNLAALEIDQTTGILKPEKSIIRLPAPVCVLFEPIKQ